MAMPVQNSKISDAIKVISEQGFQGMAEVMQLLMNEAMQVERTRYLQANPYERTDERKDYANGFKSKTVKTAIGALDLRVPQTRDGGFYPGFLEKGQRCERALKIALAEMYVQGVSTRNVTAILQELCGCEISSTEVSRAAKLLDEELNSWRDRPLGQYRYLFLDARYEKVREGGCVRDSAVLIAYGINRSGHREILGVSVSLSEAEIHWRQFLEQLMTRGLHGIELIISDAHSGLKMARKAVFPSVPWQRCQFHLQQNAQAYVTRMNRKREVAESIRAIFNAENAQEAERLVQLTAAKYEKEMPKLSAWLVDNIFEGLMIFQFPLEHRRRLRTSNIAERVNQEIRRRTRVARIFPNTASCERLVSAILMETSEQWVSGKIYLTVE